MRIALLGPIAWRTPPLAYGPWEQVVSLLAEGLVARGVEVTLFATGDSSTSARLESVVSRPYQEDPDLDGRVWEAIHVAECFRRSARFDLVHNHLDWLPLVMESFCAAPLVTTVHGFCSHGILPAYQRSRSTFVSISDADRGPGVDYAATIHHGIDVDRFALGLRPSNALLVFGRIHPDKGTAEAIEIAALADRPLLIAGPVHDERYFTECVLPHIDQQKVRYLGNVGGRRRSEVLGSAAALLHPIAFAEPFGLSVVEAMACGTPVITYPRGAMPEIVDEGVTGFLVRDARQAARAVGSAVSLDRRTVRATAVRRFSAARMVDDYLRLYERLIGRGMLSTVAGQPNVLA